MHGVWLQPRCPSRNVTLTASAHCRATEMARQPQGSKMYAAPSGATNTTASRPARLTVRANSACPVGINTGDLVKAFALMNRPTGARRSRSASRSTGTRGASVEGWRSALADVIQQTVGTGLSGVTEAARLVIASDLMPEVPADAPSGASHAAGHPVRGCSGRVLPGLHQPDLRA